MKNEFYIGYIALLWENYVVIQKDIFTQDVYGPVTLEFNTYSFIKEVSKMWKSRYTNFGKKDSEFSFIYVRKWAIKFTQDKSKIV